MGSIVFLWKTYPEQTFGHNYSVLIEQEDGGDFLAVVVLFGDYVIHFFILQLAFISKQGFSMDK